ncbi:SGNH/GDSL hydrolase family protein [Anaerosporobacter faecicola]|uniref:SGNH/GDSL hydrolase family protein n=1 Tax=Anaerosporobacter faecicola TaxID=2718714 RepID=UPI0014391663|nr:SGNH/GDSL hydrolase family protein [Anaerosporobacter faecicola]
MENILEKQMKVDNQYLQKVNGYKTVKVNDDNEQVKQSIMNIVGRYSWQKDILYLAYSASYIEFTFEGSKAEISVVTDLYKDKEGKEDIYHGWLAIYVDDWSKPVNRVEVTQSKQQFTIYNSKEVKPVTIRIMKYSEAAFSKIGFEGIYTDGEVLTPPKKKARKLEFIGDSITCGYGVEGVAEKDIFTTAQENPTYAYAYQCAQLLNAQHHLVSWSGIGIITNYVDETVNEPFEDRWLMPALYEYTDGELERSLEITNLEQWDFNRYTPDAIVINIGTNDASYTRGIEERQQYFAERYEKFVCSVREKNPNAYILCVLGTMNQELCEIEHQKIKRLQEEGDNKIQFLCLPSQNEQDGLGTDFHPSKITHTKVAHLIAEHLKETLNW